MILRSRMASCVISVILLALVAMPAKAILIEDAFVGQVDFIDSDLTGGVFAGLLVGDEVTGTATYDDALITGDPFEFVAYQSLSFSFSSIGLTFSATVDPFNELEFSFGDFIGISASGFEPTFDYFATGSALDIFDLDTFASISASFVLPPNVIGPIGNPPPGPGPGPGPGPNPVPIPEPGMLEMLLLGLGLMLVVKGFAMRRRRVSGFA